MSYLLHRLVSITSELEENPSYSTVIVNEACRVANDLIRLIQMQYGNPESYTKIVTPATDYPTDILVSKVVWLLPEKRYPEALACLYEVRARFTRISQFQVVSGYHLTAINFY